MTETKVEAARARVLFDPRWLLLHAQKLSPDWTAEAPTRECLDRLRKYTSSNLGSLNACWQAQWLLTRILAVFGNYPLPHRPLLTDELVYVRLLGRELQRQGKPLKHLTEESIWSLWTRDKSGVNSVILNHIRMCTSAGMFSTPDARAGLRWYLHIASGDWRGIWKGGDCDA